MRCRADICMAPMTGSTAGASPAAEMQRTAAPVSSQSTRLLGYILRLLAIALTLIATIVMGAAKQTKSFNFIDPNSGTVFTSSQSVKSTESSAFVYFVAANAIVCVFSAVTVGLLFTNSSTTALDLPVAVADLLALGFLFTSNAAAMAVEVVARKGISEYGWGKFCDIANKFCGQVTASIVLSSFATVGYVLILVLSIISLNNRSRI